MRGESSCGVMVEQLGGGSADRGALLEPGHRQIVAPVVIRFSGELERTRGGSSDLNVNGRRGASASCVSASVGCDLVLAHLDLVPSR